MAMALYFYLTSEGIYYPEIKKKKPAMPLIKDFKKVYTM